MNPPSPAIAARVDAQYVWACAQLAQGHAAPLFREVSGDLDTPVSVYLKLRDAGPSFLLESVEGGERLARYSFIGAAPRAVLRLRDGRGTLESAGGGLRPVSYADPLELIASLIADTQVAPNPELPRFQGGAVGYLAYDAVASFERLPVPAHDPIGAPDAVFLLCDDLVVFDHVRHAMRLVTLARPNGPPDASYATAQRRLDRVAARLAAAPPEDRADGHRVTDGVLRYSRDQQAFEAMVRRAQEYIAAGDIIQVVPSLRISRTLGAEPFAVYRALRRINPSPYMYYLDLGELQIVGASPEMLVQCEGQVARTRPIAGTRRRGDSPAEDEALARELLADPKERAEHVMLVDLGRNDLGRVAAPGGVRVDRLMEIEQFSHVMHIVSEVSGVLRPGKRGVDALRACFPAGTLSGAPKIRAMEIIAELEDLRRGPYGGAVGYLSYSGDLDTAITIRTMVVSDGVAHIQAGAGIVADSVPASEYVECQNKAHALLRAIEVAEEAAGATRAR
ncbi:MAG: anthranilate synthase component I [Actinobacteria bacterium]|nr:anthranilate synthase component I [Actinomycetota bacterium]